MSAPNTEQRFWSVLVDKRSENECWPWTGGRYPDGYGRLRMNGSKPRRAHRVAYELAVGEVSADMLVCHTCDNPLCCNPKHLFLGTHQDNYDDMVTKGRDRGKVNLRASMRLSDDQVREIRAARESGVTSAELAERNGVSVKTIWNILCGSNRKAVA